MCAVFGIIGEYDSSLARKSLEKLQHRGPDFCGVVEREDLFFAHQRLSIVDSSSNAHQPLQYKNILLSFNGEIYNFKELKRELDFEFKSESDSEVLIAAYLKWGRDFVAHLEGMFAIALLDGDELYLFRDRFGKKPLFYLQQNSHFVFASELKAVVPFLKQVHLDEDALMSYLSFLAPTAPFTFFKNIKKLGCGEYLHFKNSKVEVGKYYNLVDIPSSLGSVQKIESDFLHSMQLRAGSVDVPMASLLSGGIDSAMIAAVSKQMGLNLTTFTLGYENFKKYDERANAKSTAQFLGVENIEVEINEKSFMQALPEVFETLDEPLNDPAAVPLYLLFERIKQEGYKVVLSGEGSDEIFLGYRQYFEYLDIEKAASLHHKNWLKKYFRANFSMNREWEWYKRIFADELLFRTSGEKFTDLQKNILMRKNVVDGSSLKYLQRERSAFENSNYSDPSSWYSYIDLHHFQAEHFLAKLDRVSMAHSIESRTPFLDKTLVENLFNIEPSKRYENGRTKDLLKVVAQKYLNDEIINRKKKGFSNPYMEYLISSGEYKLIRQVNEKTGLFHNDVIEKYIEMAKKGRFKQHTWGLYILSLWLNKWML